MRMKRVISAALAVVLTLALALPAGAAAQSSFTDIPDRDTAVNADILRLMGVTDGVGGNLFGPGGTLTRAELATMAVKFMQKGGEAPLYANRTIFTDVTARHWCLPYVNLAASVTLPDGEKQMHLVGGRGDGKFHPDDTITMAETVTILLRMLGYTSKDTGSAWPGGYMNLAKSIGLTDGISAGTYDTITRGQTARLFANALRCKGASGDPFYQSLGTPVPNAILLAVGVPTDDGSSKSAIRVATDQGTESYLAVASGAKPSALLGQRGILVLNDKKRIVTFVPDSSSSIQITLSGDAQPSYLKSTDGRRYVMSRDTMLYTAQAQSGQSYLEGYANLKSGDQLTLYTENGKIVAVYATGGLAGSGDSAVVVKGTPSAAMFHQLTGGITDFKVIKNRQVISVRDLKEWDVVTYDSMNNALLVSDLRLSCVYEDAAPNAQAPTGITAMGNTFQVLDSAWSDTADLKIGQRVVLLLTADGKVAGVAKDDSGVTPNAIGVVTENSAQLFLGNGRTLTLKGEVEGGAQKEDRLVTISSYTAGRIAAYPLNLRSSSGEFQVKEMKLDGHTVAAGCRIFERVSGGGEAPTDLSDLDMDTVPANKVAGYHLDAAGMVDYLVLEAVTGNNYIYGILSKQEVTSSETVTVPGKDENGKPTTHENTITYTSGGVVVTGDSEAHSAGPWASNHSFTEGKFGGVARSASFMGDVPRAASVIELKEVTGVRPGDFFESQGKTYVKAGGYTYQVVDDVQCYKSASKSWFPTADGSNALAACKAFSKDMTIYVDPVAQRVRIVEAR